MEKAPWQAEWEIGPALATRLVESQFPDLAPVRWSVLGEGWDNLALLANDAFVFRFPRRKMGAEIMESELGVLPQLGQRFPGRTPNITHVGQPTEEFPVRFAGYPRLPGVTGCRRDWTIEQRSSLAAPLAEFLRQLHAIDEAEAKSLNAPPDLLDRTGIPKRPTQGREHLEKAHRTGLLPLARKARLADYLKDIIESPPPPASERHRSCCLVHGDLYMRHLLLDDATGQFQAVIDWGDIHYGDPAIDLAIAICHFPADALQEFVRVYGAIENATRRIAMMRAIQHTSLLTTYAHDIHDEDLLRAALASLAQLEHHLIDGTWL